MSERLSQREIDQLLRATTGVVQDALREADTGGANVVPYDFVRPARVSKERRTTLESVFARFGVGVQAHLTSRLRSPMDVVVRNVDQATFSEFILSLGSPCAVFVFSLGEQVAGRGLIDMSTDVSLHVLDRLFGGPGQNVGLQRPLTAIERTVARGVADRFAQLLAEAVAEHVSIAPEIVDFESNPESLQVMDRDDNVILASLEIRSAGFSGFVTVCLPVLALDALLQERAAPRSRGPADGGASRIVLECALRESAVTVAATLPVAHLPAAALAALVPGEVLRLGHEADTLVDVRVNGWTRFQGTLGRSRSRVGVQIVSDAARAMDAAA